MFIPYSIVVHLLYYLRKQLKYMLAHKFLLQAKVLE